MIKRNIALVFSTNALILGTSVVTSLLGAWALGPEGRGEVALVTLWPHLFMYFASLGMPHAMRYWAARRADWTSALISQSILYAMVAGTVALIGAELFVPFWVGPRHPTLIWMIRLFLFNVPLILLFELLRGVLEGARQFGWLGAARFAFFGAQGIGYAALFLTGRLTVKTAVLTIALAQVACTALALIAVLRELRPVWGTSREVFQETLRYGLRSYPGQLTENSMLRLDQVMLASLASSAFIGLYAVAVALAEITVTLGSAVSDAMLPEVAVTTIKKDARHLLSRGLLFLGGAQLLAIVPACWLAPYLLGLVYGHEFAAATDALRVLLVASAILSLGNLLISGLNGLGHPGLSAWSRIAATLTTIVTMPLFLRWGLVGAAAATLSGYFVLLALALLFHYRLKRLEAMPENDLAIAFSAE